MHSVQESEQKRVPFHEEFAQKIIEGLKNGTAPFIKPWEAGISAASFNMESGKMYRGVNHVSLAADNLSDPRFLTLKQANAHGWKIRKGEKAHKVVYWQFNKEEPILNEAGKPVFDENGTPVTQTVQLERPLMRYAFVFNGTQIDGIPPYEPQALRWNPEERAEKVLSNSQALLKHDQRDRAFYHPATDAIHLPPKAQFPQAASYYTTALHELGHWTGADSRLNRDMQGGFGTENYAREELRAEIASWMICTELGIGHRPDEQHLRYIDSWITALEKEPYEIVRACRDAEQIKDHVLQFALEKEQSKGTDLTQTKEHRPTGTEVVQGHAENQAPQRATEKTLLQVPYAERNAAKQCGCRWDGTVKSWYAPKGVDLRAVAQWLPTKASEKTMQEQSKNSDPIQLGEDRQTGAEKTQQRATEKTLLQVPYEEKEAAKRCGCRWDGSIKSWYAPEGVDLLAVAQWMPTEKASEKTVQTLHSTVSPAEEFGQRLQEAGLELDGLPVLDGNIHRVPVTGKTKGRDGAYQGFTDGRPAGWFENHVTGEREKWVYSEHALRPEQLDELRQNAELKKAQNKELQVAKQEQAAKRCYAIWKNEENSWAQADQSYLASKGVSAFGVKSDKQGNLLIPGRDVDGKIHTLQTISSEAKRFERNARKQGMMHVIDPKRQLGTQPIVLAEGYATAASLHMALDVPVVCAFDTGNLVHVAKALHAKYPEQSIVFMADNDHHKTVNTGVSKAIEAAEAVGGSVFAPEFSKEEKEQKLTDWNDLHQRRGLETLRVLIAQAKPRYVAKEQVAEQKQDSRLAMAMGA